MQRPAASAPSCWLGRSAHVCLSPTAQPSNPFLCRKPVLKRSPPKKRCSVKRSPSDTRAGVTPPEVLYAQTAQCPYHTSFVCCTCIWYCRTAAEGAFHQQDIRHPRLIGQSLLPSHVTLHNTSQRISIPADFPVACLHRCNDQSDSTAQQRMVSAWMHDQ